MVKVKKISSRSWQLIIPSEWGTIEAIKERCKAIARNYYFILHNFDKNELNEPVKPHWHFLMTFPNGRNLETVKNYFAEFALTEEQEAKAKELKEANLEPLPEFEGKIRANSFEKIISIQGAKRYLIHADDPSKYQYFPTDVETNDLLFSDSFLPKVAKAIKTDSIEKNFKNIHDCKNFWEFKSLFYDQFLEANSIQQINMTISLHKYYKDFYEEKKDDGFSPIEENAPLPF